MARRRRHLALALLAAFAACACGHADAEMLARLTVTSFVLAADPHPQVEVPFHVVVTARVRERVTQLDNLDLPILAELELLGDERRWTSDVNGSTYRETITVVAHHTGTIHLAPATLDCIDARDGKAKRYSSNALDVAVGGAPLEPVRNAGAALLTLVEFGAGLACALLVIVLVFRRRSRAPEPVPMPVEQAVSAAPRPVRTREDDLRDALATLQTERSRAGAMRVRAFVRALVGANERETLYDVLARPQAREPAMREVLRTLERAAFTYDDDLAHALDAAIGALERATA